jgi:putative heme-binding domain-containing protein
LAFSSPVAAQAPGLKVPPGFEVTEYAGPDLANDIYCLTLDPKGRVVVSGRGYIRILVGTNKAERAIDFADSPKDGAMGLLWEGDTLYVTGDGGLRRFTTKDGDHATGQSTLIRKMKTGGEHDAHALARGPDGWLYVLCGNNTAIDRTFAQLPTSPVKDPVAGCVLRFAPDFKHSEIVADGFRNAYGMDFNPDGELFTWDSDNERCLGLPWYEGTRFYHVHPGGNYGWLAPQQANFWRRPPYFIDVVPPLLDMGRGSPTGVACYRHVQFPEKYRGGFFLCDWTFGKVWHVSLTRHGATYKAEKELFLEATGDNGFAPTACCVHPETGDLYLSIGGRGTRGAVYRVRHPQGLKGVSKEAAARWQPEPRSLDWQPGMQKALLTGADAAHELRRLAVLRLLVRHADQFSEEQRLKVIKANWVHADPYLRKAAADLIRTLPDERRGALMLLQDPEDLQLLTVLQASVDTDPAVVLRRAIDLWVAVQQRGREPDRPFCLACCRLIQLALGDLTTPAARNSVWEGYTPRLSAENMADRVGAAGVNYLRGWLPQLFRSHQDPLVRRELARVMAMVADGKWPGSSGTTTRSRLLEALEKAKDPVEAFHYLAACARLEVIQTHNASYEFAGVLLALDGRMDQAKLARERHWPLRLGEIVAELARSEPELGRALLERKEFGQPEHLVLVKRAKLDRREAAAIFLKKGQGDPNYAWNAGIIELLGELPPEQTLPLLRKLWGKAGVDAAILPLLAREPAAEDRSKLLDGLTAPQLDTVRLSLEALRKLPVERDPQATFALLRAVGTLPDGKDAAALRQSLFKYLAVATGKDFGSDREAWLKWFAQVEPKLAAKLTNPDGVDVEGWNQRLAKLDWTTGDAGRGKAVFLKANCASCHRGTQALGPDLAGVAGRFSRADLFTAILQPSKDVADRYRTTVIETQGGKLYQGVVIYEAVDGVILHTGPATTVRIAGKDIAARRVSNVSLMPAGLLDNLMDQEIVDLYAYLRKI